MLTSAAKQPPAGVIGEEMELSKNNDATIPVKKQISVTTTRPGSAMNALIFDDMGLAPELDTDILAQQYRGPSTALMTVQILHLEPDVEKDYSLLHREAPKSSTMMLCQKQSRGRDARELRYAYWQF